jgi:tetratricopeptide (TPR) repeat protein
LVIFAGSLPGQTQTLRDALAALQRGDYALAESKLRPEIRLHPGNAEALSLLGAVLDSQKKLAEAETLHRKAIAIAPRSSSIVDKYGSHLVISGQEDSAVQTFLNALDIDPADGYANLQLAQIAVHRKNGPEALRRLDHLSPGQRALPQVALLDFVAYELADKVPEADAIFVKLKDATPVGSGSVAASAASALADAGLFGRAEFYFARAAAADPGNFSHLYNFGVTAVQASDYEHAREALGEALKRQPDNVNVLYSLALADNELKQDTDALALLRHAAQLDSTRADIQKLLAIVTSELKDYKAAEAAWDRYMRLAPDDDSARRERGYARAHIAQLAEGIADLKWYTAKHPDDPVAWFELGVAESSADPMMGMSSFDRAIALTPNFAAARSARGALYHRQGKTEAALPDLEMAAAEKPDDPLILDRLGQAYLTLDRMADALPRFRKAAALAPNDLSTQLHLANALAQAGFTDESELLMEHVRKLSGR